MSRRPEEHRQATSRPSASAPCMCLGDSSTTGVICIGIPTSSMISDAEAMYESQPAAPRYHEVTVGRMEEVGEQVALPPECIITHRATAEWVIIHS